MKTIRRIALLTGMIFTAVQYQRYKRDKIRAIQQFRVGSECITLPNGQLEVVIEGEGKPMLAIHGGGGGYEQGLIVGRLLNVDEQFQIIAPSRAGARQSTLETGTTFSKQAETYVQLLDHLGIDKTVIIGLSGGGLSSLQFAHDYPDRCEALVLVSAVSPLIAQQYVPQLALTVLDLVMSSDFVSWIIQQTAMRALYFVDGTTPDDYDMDSQMPELINNFFPSSEWRENVMNDMHQVLAMDDFPFEAVTVPTLLLHGGADPIIAEHVAQYTAERIPNANLITIPEGSHLMVGSDRDILQQHLRDFLF